MKSALHFYLDIKYLATSRKDPCNKRNLAIERNLRLNELRAIERNSRYNELFARSFVKIEHKQVQENRFFVVLAQLMPKRKAEELKT